MKKYKIIMRSCCDVTKNYEPIDVIKNNYIWTNTGNMLFPYSIWKMLSNEADITPYKNIKVTDANYINENFDCFIIPLANAFRESFQKELIVLTNLISKLTIPCIVIGVGLQSNTNATPDEKYPFDDVVKKFCKVVLEHSNTIGVRGKITKDYLVGLGVDSDRIDIIGCPSMYMNGRNLEIKKKKFLDKDSIIALNDSYLGISDDVNELFENIENNYKNYQYIPQKIEELKLVYAGIAFDDERKNKVIKQSSDKIYKENHVKTFINVPAWLNYMKNVDLSIGSRIHGNIAAILSGTPAFIIAPDSRVQELADYHGIPYVLENEFDKSWTIESIYENLDFEKFKEVHPKNYDNFIDFLIKNNLHPNKKEPKDFEKVIENTKYIEDIKTIFEISKEELAERLTVFSEYVNDMQNKSSKLWHLNEEYKNTIVEQKNTIKEQSRKLRLKSVRCALMIHEILKKLRMNTLKNSK